MPAIDETLDLMEAAADLEAILSGSSDDHDRAVGRRLHDCVIRPLRLLPRRPPPDSPTGPNPATPGASTGGDGSPEGPPVALSEQLWTLARTATELRATLDEPELQEATAALQDMAVDQAGAEVGAVRRAELTELQADVDIGVVVAGNGPYLVTNVARLTNWLGETLAVTPQMALCRCGASAIKPVCDGTHATNGYTDAKDPKRVADRLDTYHGVRLTVHDNRGTCAHSGFCTDRLASVFHLGEEPFVTPSGGRLDDIARSVRSCPSGALSYTLNASDHTGEADSIRPAAIEVSKDGPYRVTGAVPIAGPTGVAMTQNLGSSAEHYSLCRCGQSQNKPFCSGMHDYVNFHDPDPDPDPDPGREPTLFEWAGGFPALTRLTRLFYEKYVPEDPLLSPLFANMSPDHPERVAAWLGETFGGPAAYTAGYGGYDHMVSQHLGKGLTEAQRARWVALIVRSADESGLPADAEFRAAFTGYLEWGSRIAAENSTPGAKPPMHMPVPRWWWVCNATPDARASALAQPADEAPDTTLPDADTAIGFDQHIKALFRSLDRQSMTFAFDLWSYQDVSAHADAILIRLQAGTMPCDGAWPQTRIDVFRRWVDTGTAP